MAVIVQENELGRLFATVGWGHEWSGIDARRRADLPHNIPLDFDQTPAASRRPDARTYQTESPAPHADYMKLVLLLAMIFLPWVAIAFAARLAFAGH